SRTPPDRSRRPLPPDDLPPAPAPDRLVRHVDKGHGRLEVRTLRTTSILTGHEQWKGLAQGFEIIRERTVRGIKTVEVGYGVTSLSEKQANAADLLKHLRDHWKIENELHYVRDVTFREDACRVRSGSAPQVLAALRNAVIHLLADSDADNHCEAIELLQIYPERARELIGVPQRE
ncbi:ISAs1 family transposase, partial [Zavarzinella formosa]|uniref:ISAs1 family transposase n=1 Tax=Zavarzinella formosa TaxID=360055 RepID=UPI00035E669F